MLVPKRVLQPAGTCNARMFVVASIPRHRLMVGMMMIFAFATLSQRWPAHVGMAEYRLRVKFRRASFRRRRWEVTAPSLARKRILPSRIDTPIIDIRGESVVQSRVRGVLMWHARFTAIWHSAFMSKPIQRIQRRPTSCCCFMVEFSSF